MPRRLITFAAAALALAWFGSLARMAAGDVVEVMVDGQRRQIIGTITEETYKTVAVEYDTPEGKKSAKVPTETLVNDPKHERGQPLASYTLADSRRRTGNYAEAIKAFEQAYAEAGADQQWIKPYSLYYGGLAAFEDAKYNQVEEAAKKSAYAASEQKYARLIKEFPNHYFVPKAAIGRGVAFMRMRQFKESGDAFAAVALGDFPAKERAAAQVWSGRLLSEQGQYDAAIAALQKARKDVMEKNPDLGYLAMLGEAYALQGKQDYRKAEELFETVGLNSPDDEIKAEAFNSRGLSLLKRGDQREALMSFLRVVVLHQDVEHEYRQALYYAAKTSREYYGDDKRAKELGDTLLTVFPNSYWAQKLKAEGVAAPAPAPK